ncbi:hypothetical protein D2T81_18035 [Azospirillum brasilense]|nr:hypothetical protein D2T81_18035 [Azospirillum brasilense]
MIELPRRVGRHESFERDQISGENLRELTHPADRPGVDRVAGVDGPSVDPIHAVSKEQVHGIIAGQRLRKRVHR